jgi:hypothetical protein
MYKSSFLAIFVSVWMAACGGGGGGGTTQPQVAAENVALGVDGTTGPAVAQALAGAGAFSFDRLQDDEGPLTDGATTIAFLSATSAVIDNEDGTAEVDVGFGSCQFTVRKYTAKKSARITRARLSQINRRLTFSSCGFNVETAGLTSRAGEVQRVARLILNAVRSAGKSVRVEIDDSGNVFVNGTRITRIRMTPVTGATGATGASGAI